MPLISDSRYRASGVYKNGHFSTVYSALFKRPQAPDYTRERLVLPDGDFIALDFILKSTENAVVLCHGLEGSSRSGYNNRTANYFLKRGFSVFAWNNRSCGGVMNTGIRLYHHGETEDLDFVLQHILRFSFKHVFLVGFSMGGAQLANYFGQQAIDPRIKAGVAISTPLSLKKSAERMNRGISRVYLNRFISKIRKKVVYKALQFPEVLDAQITGQIKSFADLAKAFIVPVYGYKNLEDFYEKASPNSSLSKIKTPLLLLNAADDPILGENNFPDFSPEENDYLFYELTKNGGHCGFPLRKNPTTFAEKRAFEFCTAILHNPIYPSK